MTVVPLLPRESLIGWLESSGRFRSNELDEGFQEPKVSETLEDILEPEVYALENEEESLN